MSTLKITETKHTSPLNKQKLWHFQEKAAHLEGKPSFQQSLYSFLFGRIDGYHVMPGHHKTPLNSRYHFFLLQKWKYPIFGFLVTILVK